MNVRHKSDTFTTSHFKLKVGFPKSISDDTNHVIDLAR